MVKIICCLIFLASTITPIWAFAQPPRVGIEQVVDPDPGLPAPSPLEAPLTPHPSSIPQQIVIPAGGETACRSAALDLMLLLTNAPTELADYTQASAAAADKVWGPKIKKYKVDCFSSINNLPPALQHTNFARWAGVLRFRGNLPQCSGFLISSDTLRTARHCFFNDDGSPRQWATNLSLVKFYTLAQPNTPISVRAIALPSSVRNAGGDVVVSAINDEIALTLTQPVGGTLPPVRAPQVGDSLVTAGPFTVDGSGTTVVSYGPGCVVTKIVGDCIVHRCQTTDGFSGAPLVAIEKNGSVSIIGMHLGPDTYAGCTDSFGTANAGWIIPTGTSW